MNTEKLVELMREEARRPASDAVHIWAVFWANFKVFVACSCRIAF